MHSNHCLRWIETAIVINYAGRWRQLLDNARKAFEKLQSQGQIGGFPALEAYRLARLTFLQNYAYVLRSAGPGEYHVQQVSMPAGFMERPLAVKILEIGQRWHYLHGSVTNHDLQYVALNF